MTTAPILICGDENEPVSRVIHRAQLCQCQECVDEGAEEPEWRDCPDAGGCRVHTYTDECYRPVCGSSRGPLAWYAQELTEAEVNDLLAEGYRSCKKCEGRGGKK